MKEIFLQLKKVVIDYKEQKVFIPWEDTDLEATNEFKLNQVVRGQIEGVEKPRVLEQLKLWWAFCEYTRLYMGIEYLDTREKMSEYVKLKTNYIDYQVFYNGAAIVKTGSLSYKTGHKKANAAINAGLIYMAEIMLKSTVETIKAELIKQGKWKTINQKGDK